MPRLALAIATSLLALFLAAPATAATRDQIIKDCADDGVLQGNYTPSELRDARQNLPSDVAEYTDCADVLRRAELPERGGAAGGDGTGAASGSGGGTLLTPATDADHRALADAAAKGSRSVRVGNEDVVPGAAGLRTGAVRNELPGPLLAALVLLTLGGIALAVPGIRRLLPLIGRRKQ